MEKVTALLPLGGYCNERKLSLALHCVLQPVLVCASMARSFIWSNFMPGIYILGLAVVVSTVLLLCTRAAK